MKRFVLLSGATLTLGLLLITAPFALAGANQLSVDYSFNRPDISEIKIGGELYHRIIMPDVPNCGNPGQPSLPARGAKILLPFGTVVSSIEVVPGEKILIDSDLIIEPVSYPVKLSAEPGTASPPIPNSVIYSSDTPFPESRFENIGTQGFRGYQILILKLQPVEYIPKSRELYYYSQLTVIINTADADKSNDLFRGLPEDEEDVMAKIDNPEQVSTYFAGGVRTDRSYEFLIITTSSLVSAFQPLENYHDNNGIPTEIRTTTDIGSSNPDDIRAYITSQYSSDGIQYVLIGADDDIIPAKDLYVAAWSGGDIEYNMPADIYYGCLDGTYNYDGDSYWGEPNDGNGGGDVDLVAEVYVGRAAVGNTTEANRFVNKTIWYLTNQHTQIANVLMVGEYLGFGGESDYAGNMMDQIVDGSSADGYTTIGIPSDIYNVDRLYERDWPNWPQSELVSRINNGLHIINHLGHGSPDYAMKLYDSDIMNQLTNNDLCFVYSQTCLAGHFDGTDCWAEYMNIKTDNGGFAVVMNARYGWGTYNSTDGPSQRFDRQFWDAVFNPSENKMELSKANQDSKEDNLYRINESCMRWCTYELNLFGDPTVAVKGISGLRVRPSANFESEGLSGGPFSPSSIVYTLENAGDYSINYNVTKSQPWITLTNASGTIPINGTIDVTVTINANANGLPDGRYEDIINFINATDHIGDTQRDVILTVGIPGVAYEWTLDTNPGWTTQNQWAFGQPTGGGGEYGGPDPTSGYTGSNVYGYNLYGDYTDNMSEAHLTSSAIDCSGLEAVTLKFWRWLGVEQPAYDHAYVRVSNDGANWTTVWENTSEITDYSWTEMELDIADIADNQSSVYLRWTMGATDVGFTYCGWNIDDIQIMALGVEEPPLYVQLPDGAPENLEPGVPTVITVQINNGSEEYVPGSGTLHYRYDGGTYLTSGLTSIGGTLYEATLPPANCNDTPEFYFSAQGNGGATVYNPDGAPGNVYTAIVGTFVIFFEDHFDTHQGWTVSNSSGLTDGAWQRGIPAGGGDRGDPPNDYDIDGLGYCYVTDNADDNSDVDDGYTWLNSPTIDLGSSNAEISYALWYTNHTGDGPNNDYFKTYVSNNNGGTWVLAETIGPYTSSGWTEHSFTVGDFVTPTSQVKIRFEASDVDPQSIVEAGIDAVIVTWFECDQLLTGSIAGVVNDAATGLPIQRVNVEAIGSGVSDETDANGEYALENIIVNTYSVSFSHEDYEDTIQHNVIVNLDEVTTLNMTMVELPGSISGVVTDASSGEAIVGATVEAVGTGVSTVTNGLGQYTLSDLDVGTYDVLFTHAWYYNLTIPDVIVTPGDITPRNAQMTILPGSIYGVVTEAAGIALSGINKGIEDKTDNIKSTALIRKSSVIEDDEKTNTLITNLLGPIEGVLVTALGTGISDVTDENGQYTLAGLDPGSYEIEFTHDWYEDVTESDVPYVPGTDYELNVEMTMLQGSISGVVTEAVTIVLSGGSQSKGIAIDADGINQAEGKALIIDDNGQDDNHIALSRGPIEGVIVTAVDTDPLVSDITNVDGEYTLDLDAGTYTIEFTHDFYYDVIRTDQEVIQGEVTILNVEMTTIPGSISGIVTNQSTGEAIEGVAVEAVGFGVSDITNIDGEYTLADLAAGIYDVSFSHQDYKDSTETGVEVIPDYTTILNMSLIPLIIADVGVSAILSPPDSILFETPYPLEVEVTNHGVAAQTFDVVFEVYISGSSEIEFSDIVTVIDMPGYSVDTVTFSSALIPEINTDYDLVSYTVLAGDEDNGNDTASTTTYTKEGVLVKYGNLDGSLINGPINGYLAIDVYVQTSENAYLGDLHLCLGSDDQYIDDHLSETLGQIYYPLTEWETAVFTAPHGSPPNPAGWTSQSFVGFARINPDNPNPLWLHLESLTKIMTFVFKIVDDEALIGQTVECLGQGLNLYQGPSNGSDSTGFVTFDIVESCSPVQFYDPTAYCDYVPGDFNGDGNVIGSDVTFGVQYFIGAGSNPPDSCWLASSGSWLYSAADANGDCVVIGSDITYLVAFFVGTGEPPQWCPETPPANPLLLEGENEFDMPYEPVRNR